MEYNRQDLITQIDSLMAALDDKPERMPVTDIINYIEEIIPVHVAIEVTDYDQVDMLLAVYPYYYQKLARLFAYFCHVVRRAKAKEAASSMRSYRDALGEAMSALKMQYDSLSRRVTVNIERR